MNKPSFDSHLVFVYQVSFTFTIVTSLYLIILSVMVQLQIMDTALINFSRKGFAIGVVEGWRAGSCLGPQRPIPWDVSRTPLLEGLPRELSSLLQMEH